MMKRDLRFSRRRLLKSIGAGAALLPMLRADRTDAACYVGGIKRLYVLAWTNGMLSSINNWATAGNDPTSWSLGTMGFARPQGRFCRLSSAVIRGAEPQK